MKRQILSLLLGLMGALMPQTCVALPPLPEDMIISIIYKQPECKEFGTFSTLIIFVNARDNKIIGYAELWKLLDTEFYLNFLEINPCYQGRGYGKRLFKLACMYAKQHGNQEANWILLRWDACPFTADNKREALPRLIKFYENLGGGVARRDKEFAGMYLFLNIKNPKRYGPLNNLSD